mgnify:CR=1 FL=1
MYPVDGKGVLILSVFYFIDPTGSKKLETARGVSSLQPLHTRAGDYPTKSLSKD